MKEKKYFKNKKNILLKLKLTFTKKMCDSLNYQKSKFTNGSFASKIVSSIMKEKCNRTRVLYAGPGLNGNTITLYRLAEVFKGKYYLEETTYDIDNKSISSSFSSVKSEHFNKIVDPQTMYHNISFESPEITSVVSYTRNVEENRNFTHMFFHDGRKMPSMFSCFTDMFLRRKLFSYMNKN